MPSSFSQIIEKLNNNELWDFPGGVHPVENKDLSNLTPIIQAPIPKYLYVTVKQHIGVEGHLIVEQNQEVLKGQPLTKSMNPFAVPVHAPTSGKILAIGKHTSAHPSGLPELTIEIESDQQDSWTELSPQPDYKNRPKIELLRAICDAGISGMGGAGFPTHIKSSPKKNAEFLIINGIECEPYITADDRLMREHAWQIRQGIDVLNHLLSPKQVLIGIENNKPEAIEAMQIACKENPNYRICVVPTKYPAGGEKQLIQILTNREVPAQGLPIDVGVIMHNVGTCFAIADAVFSGKPLIQRVVTVTGQAISKPGNYWALMGTPISHLLEQGQYQEKSQKHPKVIMGGPMMGFTVLNDTVPVVKTTNCILAPSNKEMTDNNEQACIRCGACADACPASLLPQQLFWHSKAKELDKAKEYNLFDCIECGACAYVCPSEIPLVHYYRVAKAEIRVEEEEKQKADKARDRFEKRAARLLADQAARDEKHRLAAEARKKAMESNGGQAKDKVAAALARAKAKKQQTNIQENQKPTTNISETAKPASSNQRVQAAIARAKAKKAAAESKKPELAQELSQQKKEETIEEPKVEAQIAATKAEPNRQVDKKSAKDPSPRKTKTATKEKLDAPGSVSPSTQEKQAKIAAAVAKAKARRQAKDSTLNATDKSDKDKSPSIQNPKPADAPLSDDEQIEMKKQRISAAVAKAKAKKAAEKAAAEKGIDK